MSRDEVIGEIEQARSRNNRNWMDLLRIALERAPAESEVVLARIRATDMAISDLTKKLLEKFP